MAKPLKRISNNMEMLVKHRLDLRLKKAVEEIKNVIISEYDQELVGVVTDRESKTNPNFYREDFIDRLNKFVFIKKSGDRASLTVPDMDSFDFSGRLKVIQAIMHGMAGTYVEVNEEDYKAIFGKIPVNQEPLDEYVPPKERIYLVRYDSKMRAAERDLKKKFVRYPFSNSPPIRILDEGELYMDKNVNRWIEEALEEAQKEFVKTYKGAKI